VGVGAREFRAVDDVVGAGALYFGAKERDGKGVRREGNGEFEEGGPTMNMKVEWVNHAQNFDDF